MDAESLVEMYRQTRYVIDDGPLRFSIRLEQPNPQLEACLLAGGYRSWAFLTAYNPLSQALPEAENLARQTALREYLDELKYRYWSGAGIGDDPAWEPEPSLFIVNIDRSSAIATAKRFGQNAILWGETGSEPELVWCQ